MGQSRQLFVYFRPFLIIISIIGTNWKKHRWCAWDLNPWPPDGRCRRNHGAMAAAPLKFIYDMDSWSVWPDWAIYCTLGNFLKPAATIILHKSPTFLAIFVEVTKSLIFLVESFLAKFYRHLATFYWSHWYWSSNSFRFSTLDECEERCKDAKNEAGDKVSSN